MHLLNAPSSKDDMDTTAINAEERSFNKHRLVAVAVAEHERLLANTHPLHLRTLPVNKNDDTKPCFTGCSRIHRLVCGHIVYTHQPTLCGKTCQIPLNNFALFLCTLCERWDMVRKGRVSRRLSSMSALVLPDFPCFKHGNATSCIICTMVNGLCHFRLKTWHWFGSWSSVSLRSLHMRRCQKSGTSWSAFGDHSYR